MNDDFLNDLRFESLSSRNWGLFEQLFGPRGACGNCWCMYYRLSPAGFKIVDRTSANRPMVRFYT